MNNEGTTILFGVCCLWPLAVHLFIIYGIPRISAWSVKQFNAILSVDWRNVNWSELWRTRNER